MLSVEAVKLGEENFFRKDLFVKKKHPYICNPISGKGLVVQLVRMPPCHGGGRGFESRPARKIGSKEY
jgi:hypothetical protein